MLTVMSDPAAAAKPTGSETYSAPAGIVTDAIPPKLSRTLVAGAICGLPRATGRAIAAASIVSGAVPNAFDKRTRTRVPPSESRRSEEHTSELQSLMRNSYAVFCLKKKNYTYKNDHKANSHIHKMYTQT